jgi:hypothetical protein
MGPRPGNAQDLVLVGIGVDAVDPERVGEEVPVELLQAVEIELVVGELVDGVVVAHEIAALELVRGNPRQPAFHDRLALDRLAGPLVADDGIGGEGFSCFGAEPELHEQVRVEPGELEGRLELLDPDLDLDLHAGAARMMLLQHFLKRRQLQRHDLQVLGFRGVIRADEQVRRLPDVEGGHRSSSPGAEMGYVARRRCRYDTAFRS